MKLREILEHKGKVAVTVAESANLASAIKIMHQHRVGAVIVPSSSGEPIGILSERDIVRYYAEGKPDFENMLVKDYMTTDVIMGNPDDTVDDVMAVMTQKRFRHMPVVQDGKIVGVVSMGDLVKSKLAETTQEAQALREYINS
jgi:CBS domain-containing protein